MVAAHDHADLQELAVIEQVSRVPSPLFTLWEPMHCKACCTIQLCYVIHNVHRHNNIH